MHEPYEMYKENFVILLLCTKLNCPGNTNHQLFIWKNISLCVLQFIEIKNSKLPPIKRYEKSK